MSEQQGSDPAKHPWYGAAITDTLAWVRSHGIGFFMLLLFLGIMVWQSTREEKVKVAELQRQMADAERRLTECEAHRASLQLILDKIVNSAK